MKSNACKGRFLVTFDDGPHANTASILEQLDTNPVQRGIKAMFFVETRNAEGGRSQLGRSLLRRESDRVGLSLENKAFYDSAPEIMRAALRRAVGRDETVGAEAQRGKVSQPCPYK